MIHAKYQVLFSLANNQINFRMSSGTNLHSVLRFNHFIPELWKWTFLFLNLDLSTYVNRDSSLKSIYRMANSEVPDETARNKQVFEQV